MLSHIFNELIWIYNKYVNFYVVCNAFTLHQQCHKYLWNAIIHILFIIWTIMKKILKKNSINLHCNVWRRIREGKCLEWHKIAFRQHRTWCSVFCEVMTVHAHHWLNNCGISAIFFIRPYSSWNNVRQQKIWYIIFINVEWKFSFVLEYDILHLWLKS